MGFTIKQRRDMIQVERDVIKNLLDDQRKIRAAIKQSRLNIKMHQEILKDERKYARIAREDQRAIRRAAKIAKLEARLEAMRLKALSPKQTRKSQQKASPVTVWSADQIAAFEATRHG
jgi:hypothetical protein